MKEQFNNLIKKLEADIAANDQEGNPLKRVSRNLLLIEEAIGEFTRVVNLDPDFRTKEDIQIEYNKNYFPTLFAKLILYKKYYDVESQKLYSTKERFQLYCERELDIVQQFFISHQRFCQYFHSGNEENDWKLFTLDNEDNYELPDTEGLLYANSNPNTRLAACLLAYEDLGTRLRRELDGRPVELPGATKKREVEFMGSETDVVELLIAIYHSKRLIVDGKPATQEFLFERGRAFFGVRLENAEQLASQIRTRQAGPVKFLEVLIDSVLDWAESSPEEKRRNKKLINKKIGKDLLR